MRRRWCALALLGLCACKDPQPRQPAEAPGQPAAPLEVVADLPAARPAAASESISTRPPPPGFVELARVPGLRLDIRYATPQNFTGAVLPGYDTAAAWLREGPAADLSEAAAALERKGLGLCIFDAYRPRRASAAMVAWARASANEHLLRDGYIAARSRHNAGVAVDVSLCAKAGEPGPDMGGPFDAFAPVSHFVNATGTAKTNRALLRKVMREHGFVPYAKEWWHFTWRGGEDEAAIDVPYSTMSTWNHHQSTP